MDEPPPEIAHPTKQPGKPENELKMDDGMYCTKQLFKQFPYHNALYNRSQSQR